ncbi:hypothetical protein QBC47DRAFT_439541 [Echria macrotheca]|uniref:Apple domain-containing protein n=1 Tax=Echria macrotheca TaxID=438768 RepID=A0AAJ0B1D5_9PEZI|nr:hypothetical protein QBC47DRAFT_439541 [Echria macrotheca]
MYRASIVAPLLLSFVSTALGDLGSDAFCSKKALNYLACRNGIPLSCIPAIATQAAEFCSGFLAVTATSVTTASQVTTVTVTQTLTSGTTATETSTTVAETTTTEISTATTSSITGTTTVTSFVPPDVVSIAPRGQAMLGCSSLSEEKLNQIPSENLASVCKCLSVTATTVVVIQTATASSTATAPASSTTTSTFMVTVVAVSSSTTTTTTTATTTLDVVATSTAVVDICSVTYNPSGEGVGNAIFLPEVSSGQDCCVLCWNTPDCVAAAFPGGCQLLVKTVPLDGAPTSPTCPLGIENYNFLPGPGVVYAGPCAVPPSS